MKRLAAFLLVAAATTSPEIRYFRYQRSIESAPQPSKQTCIALEAPLFAHAAPGLSDLRLYRDRQETPYLIQLSAPASTASEQSVQPLNPGSRGGQTVFDAVMPSGDYSDLNLDVLGHDFIAAVAVTGSQQQTGPATKIGEYTIFDLTRQRLGRSTVLHLPHSDFRFLHFRIAGPLGPESVRGLSLKTQAAEKPQYTVVAETTRSTRKSRTSVVELSVPAHVPVDRIVVVPGATPANFSRDVTIEVRPILQSPLADSAETPAPISSIGNLLRVHTVEDDHHIDLERLDLDAPQTAFDGPSQWTVTIDNGDDAPLLPTSVRLEMVRRQLCFESSAGHYTLYYGDAKLALPHYDLGQFLVVRLKDAVQASAGPEQPNPEYQPRPDGRPFTERHPVLLWIALALVVLVLGATALRTARTTKPQHS